MHWNQATLKAAKYDGLLCPNQCACKLTDLRPCGYASDITDMLCKPGTISEDDEGPGFWIVSGTDRGRSDYFDDL